MDEKNRVVEMQDDGLVTEMPNHAQATKLPDDVPTPESTTTSTTLSETLSSTEYKSRYDASAKELLSEKIFLALIMKFCIDEYKDCDLEEIVGLIESEPEVGVVPLNRDLARKRTPNADSEQSGLSTTPEKSGLNKNKKNTSTSTPRITGSDTVDKSQDEGTYYFDILFNAALPDSLVDEATKQSGRGKNKSIRQALGVIINIEPHGENSPGYPLNTSF